jgi:hypothetical protein
LDYFDPDISTITDYYAFGSLMPERHWSDPELRYKYGFNGKEGDDEISGRFAMVDLSEREYAARLCKMLSMDPLFREFPYWSPYSYSGVSPR